jgi:hypothetical protein
MQNSENIRHKYFRSNFDPGKTHKGKTSERGICIIYELLRNSFTAYSSSEIYTNLSGHSCSFASQFLNQKFVQLYDNLCWTDCHEIRAKTLLRFNFCASQCYSATLECMPMLPEISAAVSFLQLDLSLALSCSLNKNASAPLLFSQQDCCCINFFPVLGISPKISWPLTKISSTSKNGCAHLP